MRYLLDTSICIYIAKKQPLSVLERFKNLQIGDVGMSIITYGELVYGCEKSLYKTKSQTVLDQLKQIIPPCPLPNQAAQQYGEQRAILAKKGKIIGGNDLWIAAHALSDNLTLVTNNTKEFSRITQLKLENWLEND